MTKFRVEQDSMGELEVPSSAWFGAQTQRAVNNFGRAGGTMPEGFIRSLILVKKHAALANKQLECLSSLTADAIVNACDLVLHHNDLMQQFPVDVFQTGSGTSSNMNANEVIAHLASKSVPADSKINPNDHVNFGQSSNDVIPTTIHVSAAIALNRDLIPAVTHLIEVIDNKAVALADYCKTGRTHLMDAMPVRMDQALSGWSAQLVLHLKHLQALEADIATLAIGGTAVGTGVNAHPQFAQTLCRSLSEETELTFVPGTNYFALISSQDTALALSGVTRNLAATLMKLANDLRWMNSGPLAGLGEIALPALQPGSSIMPGKVNPVVPEAVAMAAAQVMGNDTTITVAAQSGNFELNVMLPVVARNLLENIHLMAHSSVMLANKAISGFTVNAEKLEDALYKNPILVTALNPVIGYQKAAEIAKLAYAQQRPIIDVAAELTDIPKQELESLLDPMLLTKGA